MPVDSATPSHSNSGFLCCKEQQVKYLYENNRWLPRESHRNRKIHPVDNLQNYVRVKQIVPLTITMIERIKTLERKQLLFFHVNFRLVLSVGQDCLMVLWPQMVLLCNVWLQKRTEYWWRDIRYCGKEPTAVRQTSSTKDCHLRTQSITKVISLR
jgi:hypothetical protein